MACGTPVLAFNTGGLPEMVVPQKSGWLVDEINAGRMITKLGDVIKSNSFNQLRNSTKESAHKLFNGGSIGNNILKFLDHYTLEMKEFEKKIGISNENHLMSSRENWD